MKMPFGKHKGKDIDQLSAGYIETLLENVPIKDKELKKALLKRGLAAMEERNKNSIRHANYDSGEWDSYCEELGYDPNMGGLDFGDLC